MLIHEQTRKEVAGLLHGRVQSRLVVLGHWLKDCQGQLKDGPAQAMESLEEANKLLREIRDQELRTITRQLYPSIIRTGLPSALNSLADRFRSVFSVEVLIDKDVAEMDNPMNPRLNESLRLTLYRVAEEALGNVAKHAQANEVWLSLSLSPARELMLVVRDNGRGFDRSTAKVGAGSAVHRRLRDGPGRHCPGYQRGRGRDGGRSVRSRVRGGRGRHRPTGHLDRAVHGHPVGRGRGESSRQAFLRNT